MDDICKVWSTSDDFEVIRKNKRLHYKARKLYVKAKIRILIRLTRIASWKHVLCVVQHYPSVAGGVA